MDDDLARRLNSDTAGRPVLIKGNSQILFGSMGGLSEHSVVNVKNKSRSVTAAIVVPAGGAEGIIAAQGGNIGGWSLIQQFHAESANALPAGEHQVRMEFAYDGGGLDKGGRLRPERG